MLNPLGKLQKGLLKRNYRAVDKTVHTALKDGKPQISNLLC
jgi:hypothetical protein